MIPREISVPLDNLADSDGRRLREERRRLGHLSELAASLAKHLSEVGEADSPRTLLGGAAGLLAEVGASSLGARDRAELTLLLLREAERRFGAPVTASALAGGPCPPPSRARTVYVRNPLTDGAYLRLSSLLSAPTVGYRQNFRELFDDVENGYADYAVLPLFAGGHFVGSVAALLEERSLFITAAVTVPTEEDEVTYGLLSREPFALRAPTHFSFRVGAEDAEALTAHLAAAARFGLSLVRMDAAPTFYGGGMTCRYLFTGEDFAPMLAYLSLFAPSFTGYGFYTELQ